MPCSNLQRGRSNRDTWKKIVQSQRFLKKDSPVFFAYGPCNNIHQFEGCFLLGQVSLNGFKNFNGCIVEYLNFINLSAKTLENLLFWENVLIWQFSSKCSLVLTVFLPTVMLLKWFSVYRLLAAASQINVNNQEHNLKNLTIEDKWIESYFLTVIVTFGGSWVRF